MQDRSVVGRRPVVWLTLCGAVAVAVAVGAAQQRDPERVRPPGLPRVPLPDVPLIVNTHEIAQVRVVVVTDGLSHPWGLAFVPGGDMLVTEREGRLRMIRGGILDPEPIEGVPEVLARGLAGLMDVALHPNFAENRLVYLSYTRPLPDDAATVALIRGRLDGMALRDVEDVFVAEPFGGATASARIAFAPDGLLFLTVGGSFGTNPEGARAQDPSSHAGKLLRLRDDGSVPDDNPFVGREGYKPEIFSMGHRNQQGLAIHPDTAAPWATEHAVQGGDELNVIEPGQNYGWPVVSYGRQYNGPRVTDRFWSDGMEEPLVFWVPSIAPSGLAFYTGDRFPQWKGNLFVGSLVTGRIGRTGHLERIAFNDNGEELAREWLLTELRQRIRDVKQGPDGLLYVLTEENRAALLRLEPVE
ncbi:MAG: PQQ-dependent sugar dehydrogenase [Vicinamibacterales bacterium]|jgi:glucose/arabinose dehydrogenase|nr:PQQ-dependent sugar dehydrogenase [Vicinamibacterales bacterium]